MMLLKFDTSVIGKSFEDYFKAASSGSLALDMDNGGKCCALCRINSILTEVSNMDEIIDGIHLLKDAWSTAVA